MELIGGKMVVMEKRSKGSEGRCSRRRRVRPKQGWHQVTIQDLSKRKKPGLQVG